MDAIFQYVDKKFAGASLTSADPLSVDIAVSRREQLMGFVLGNELLLLRHKNMTTFRLNWSSIGSISDLTLAKSLHPINRDQLQSHFAENGDNPYALQNIFFLLQHHRPLNAPTQLPPLIFPKTRQQQSDGIDRLFDLADPFDLFFTFNRGSGVSRVIRYVDRGHWSHVGILDANKCIVEFTTGGASRSSFDHLKDPLLDVGLYRMKDDDSYSLDRKRQQASIEQSLVSGDKYCWSVIPRAFLRKWFRQVSICPDMPSDLIRWDIMRLVGYA